MRRKSIIVAFGSRKTSGIIVNMLSWAGISVDLVCSSAAEVRQHISYLDEGIVICGYKLKDSSVISLLDDISDEFSIILIGSLSKLDLCEDARVFKLAIPLRRDDLVCSVKMIMNIESEYGASQLKSAGDREKVRLIEQAKHILMYRYHMSEEEAHRYIQKKSMDTGTKMIDIARIIMN